MALALRRAQLLRSSAASARRSAWFGQPISHNDDPGGEAWRLHKTNEPVRTQPRQTFLYAARHVDLNPELSFSFSRPAGVKPAAPAAAWPIARPTPAPGPGFYSLVTATNAARSGQ